jgi:hypothetical protein
MPVLKRILVFACAVISACGGGPEEGTPAEDTLAMEPAPPAPTITLADVAGTWNLAATTERGDSIPGLQLVATADPSGWFKVVPGHDPVPLTVMASGDSIVTDAGPYSSLIRDDVLVSVHLVYRLDGDRLIGSGIARYQTSKSDSVVSVREVGTRAP